MIFHVRMIPFGSYTYPYSSEQLQKIILASEEAILKLDPDWTPGHKSPTSARYRQYNFLNFPGSEDFKTFLRQSIDDFYRRMNWKIPKSRYLQCWVNIHRNGEHLHAHAHQDCKMSGHMTVACQGTRTTYFKETTFEIENEPGLLTLIGCDRVPHYTSPVIGDVPRISIAFDLYESDEKVREHWVKLESEG